MACPGEGERMRLAEDDRDDPLPGERDPWLAVVGDPRPVVSQALDLEGSFGRTAMAQGSVVHEGARLR